MPEQKDDSIDWKESIVSQIKEEEDDSTELQVKKLRKKVLKSLELDDSDKSGKKSFKKTMKSLEEEGALTIDAEGVVTLANKKKRKKEKKEKKSKKEKKNKKRKTEEGSKEDEDHSEEEEEKEDKQEVDNTEDDDKQAEKEEKPKKSEKGIPCDGNPGGVTRLFLGNLPFAVDENSLSDLLPSEVTHIKWITDKETGKFYGSAFIEMDTPTAAAGAVALATTKLMGRPVKINYAPSRPGDVWPPASKVVLGGASTGTTTGGSAGGRGAKAMGEKPAECVKLFIGNLSYDIDDETITKFFDNVDAEVKAVRWLSHKDTGDFKGCGFVEFWNTDACNKAATQNGKNLLNRPIRIDWSD